jgi:DNA-binding MarR family transcriptional regulator
MASRMFTTDQKVKLTQLLNEGAQVLREVEDLNEGLNDTVKAIAEEIDVKPAILKKAIKVAAKGEFSKYDEDHVLLEDILDVTGKK